MRYPSTPHSRSGNKTLLTATDLVLSGNNSTIPISIQASTPMYLLSQKIKAQRVKMVLSGEGSDEIFGGYLNFGNALDGDEFYRKISTYLRAFVLISSPPRGVSSKLQWELNQLGSWLLKERIEKYILRKAFDTTNEPDVVPYLPDEILWCQKEQFSDRVGYGWDCCNNGPQISEGRCL